MCSTLILHLVCFESLDLTTLGPCSENPSCSVSDILTSMIRKYPVCMHGPSRFVSTTLISTAWSANVDKLSKVADLALFAVAAPEAVLFQGRERSRRCCWLKIDLILAIAVHVPSEVLVPGPCIAMGILTQFVLTIASILVFAWLFSLAGWAVRGFTSSIV